jgi:IS5 family transposase
VILQPFSFKNQQHFGFQKTRLKGMVQIRRKVNVLAALTNLFLALKQ